MNNMTFPEMNSATSSAAGSDILETLNTNLNIFNMPQVTNVDTPKAPMTMQIPRPQQAQPPQPPPVRPQQTQQTRPQQAQQAQQARPQQTQQIQQTPQPRPQQTQQSQPQQKSVSFNNNVQQKVISPVQQQVKPVQEISQPNLTNELNENSISITEAAIKLAENEAAVAATASHLIKLGSFKMPKQTLILIGGVVLISVGLFFATKPKTHKKKEIKKPEDDE